MRKIIISLHTTLDGFVAGPNGEMDWIKFDDELFDVVGKVTNEADTALYGRVTYEMMASYWPGAADLPGASKHDIEHSQWYNSVHKVVISRTLTGDQAYKTTFIGHNVPGEIAKIKNQPGKNILIFGSPAIVHVLMEHSLIDEYWLFINPVILGKGIPLFIEMNHKAALKLVTSKTFPCGVIGLNYTVVI
jgi:dihydrofolate reductase